MQQGLLQDVQPILDAIANGVILVDSQGMINNYNTLAQNTLNIAPGADWATVLAQFPNLHFKASPYANGQLITLLPQYQDENVTSLGKMVASLAHQIKTPLATAMLYAQLLLDKTLPELKVDNYIIKVNERLKNVIQIIDSLMILIKGVTPVPVRSAVKDLQEELLQYVKDKKLYVDFECLIFNSVIGEAFLDCDLKTLVSGIGNLINNSIEATTNLAKILILLSEEDGYIKIMVSDKGPGMSEHYKNNLFKPFISTKVTGTGLGLAILQIIVKSYGGQIMVESDHSYGTKVIIKLPMTN